jgi:hypothetical protein
MEEFNFDDTEMSTSINQLRKKKSEIDDENNSYTDIRMKLYDEIKSPPILQTNNISHKQHSRLKKNKKQNKNIKHANKHFYFNILIFSLIFFFVNNYYLNNYFILKKFSYYTVVFIKLVLFLTLYYMYKYLIN